MFGNPFKQMIYSNSMSFTIISEDGAARVGTLTLPSGKTLSTPFFMPVMTKGAAKNISPEMLSDAGTQCCISNSFILTLKPGVSFIKQVGGLHKFANWKGGLFTDSGGFQMLSQSLFKSINNEAVTFRNPFDGKNYSLTPEQSIRNQCDIGADVIMALDHVPPYFGVTKEQMIEYCNRTHYWAKRCKIAHSLIFEKKPLLFGITQGGIFPDLRQESAKFINSLNFDGIAFGGFCFGEKDDDLYKGIQASKKYVDKEKPIYIMGMGHPVQLLEAIGLGCDIFDSTFPTMSARHGTLFTKSGNLRILNAKYKYDSEPIEKGCACYACKNYSRAFIHHLLELHENFGKTLATIHNIYFMHKLLEDAKEAIKKSKFKEFKEIFIENYRKKSENVFKYA